MRHQCVILIIFVVYSVDVTLARVKIVFSRCFMDCRIFCPITGDILSLEFRCILRIWIDTSNPYTRVYRMP